MVKKVPIARIQKFALEHNLWCMDDSKDYKAKDKRRWVCMRCGGEFWKTWDGLKGDIQRGRAFCPLCAENGTTYRRTIYEMDKLFYKEGYRIRRIHTSSHAPAYNEKLWVECDKGHCNWLNWDGFSGKRKGRCPTCKGGVPYTPKKVRGLIENVCHYDWVGDNDEYKNARSKLTLKCPICHAVFKKSFLAFYDSNQRCPVCNSKSKMESVTRYFIERAIPKSVVWKKEHQVTINGKEHRFDFVLWFPCQTVAIETDGDQHRVNRTSWGRKNYLQVQKIKDREKDMYAKEKGWVMLRYPDTIPLRDLISCLKKDLSRWTNFTEENIDIQEAVTYGRKWAIEVAKSYNNHTKEEVSKLFHVSKGTVHNCYIEYYGETKWKHNNIGKSKKRSGN